LDILETSSGDKQGSLFGFIDNCKTSFGRRELKRWIIHPLINISKINDRLDAVGDLIKNKKDRDYFATRFSMMPDLERLLSKILLYCVKQKNETIQIKEFNIEKLNEFQILLQAFAQCKSILDRKLNSYKSIKLR